MQTGQWSGYWNRGYFNLVSIESKDKVWKSLKHLVWGTFFKGKTLKVFRVIMYKYRMCQLPRQWLVHTALSIYEIGNWHTTGSKTTHLSCYLNSVLPISVSAFHSRYIIRRRLFHLNGLFCDASSCRVVVVLVVLVLLLCII